MDRGAIVIVSAQGDYGKPRPSVVIQSTEMTRLLSSVTVCMMTSDLIPANPLRITIEPSSANGLHLVSQIQVEKITTFPNGKIRGPIGALEAHQIGALDRGLTLFLGLLDIKR